MTEPRRLMNRLFANGRPVGPAAKRDDAHLLATGHEACAVLAESGVPHMVGGGIAVWVYGRRRYTKDMDLFIPPEVSSSALDALANAGFDSGSTDADWLFKAYKGGVMIDIIIWTTGNVQVDAETFARSRCAQIDGHTFTVMGPEDVLFRKILSHKEERRDWYDGVSMLAQPIAGFDWEYFLHRIGGRFGRRALSFLLYAQSELGTDVVPPEVIAELVAMLAHEPPPEPRLGPILFAAEASETSLITPPLDP